MWNTYALVWILTGVIPTYYDIVVNQEQEERETVVVVRVQFQLSIPTHSTRRVKIRSHAGDSPS